eukprot:679159-Pleurochrysis_carterae.AAC.1
MRKEVRARSTPPYKPTTKGWGGRAKEGEGEIQVRFNCQLRRCCAATRGSIDSEAEESCPPQSHRVDWPRPRACRRGAARPRAARRCPAWTRPPTPRRPWSLQGEDAGEGAARCALRTGRACAERRVEQNKWVVVRITSDGENAVRIPVARGGACKRAHTTAKSCEGKVLRSAARRVSSLELTERKRRDGPRLCLMRTRTAQPAATVPSTVPWA